MKTNIEKMKQELVEYTFNTMTYSEIMEYAKKGIRLSLDKLPLSVVEWKHQTLLGEDNDIL